MIPGSPDAVPPATTAPAAGLAQAEARVEAHSASLKKELGVRDLALTQILFIVGLSLSTAINTRIAISSTGRKCHDAGRPLPAG